MKCPVCGEETAILPRHQVLWADLISEWRLSPPEADYLDKQQGAHCPACGCSMRSMALANAIMRAFAIDGGVTLERFIAAPPAARLRVLEVNEAGDLGKWLARLPGHERATYPSVDMEELPYADDTFHAIIHSDTLEHVAHPVRALAECRRVLKTGGSCCFTVPIVVGRLSSSRDGLPPSYHSKEADDAMRVRTEFGADVWGYAIEAGFAEARLVALEYPAGLAVVAVK